MPRARFDCVMSDSEGNLRATIAFMTSARPFPLRLVHLDERGPSIDLEVLMASNTPPFLVHLIFHPASDKARSAALALHKALNSDSALPGLAVPTALLPEDGSGLPPKQYDLNQ